MAFDPNKVDLGSLGELTEVGFEDVNSQLRNTVDEAFKVDPVNHSKITKLSRDSGVPEFAVESNIADVEHAQKVKKFDAEGITKESPKTAKFLSNFNNAVTAQGDIDLLKEFEKIFDFGKSFENFHESNQLAFESQGLGLLAKGVDKTATRVQDLISPSALPLGMEGDAFNLSFQLAERFGIKSDEQLKQVKEDATDQMITQLKEVHGKRANLQPEDLNLLEEGLRAGADSLYQMAPGAGLMVLSGGRAAPLLGAIGLQTYADSYGSGRSEGLTPEEATWFASIDAAIEVGTELIPLKTLETIMTGASKGLSKAALKFAVQEMGTEQIATLGQSINSFAFGLDQQMEQAETVQEMLDIQGRRQAVTAIATIFAGGAQATAAATVNKTINKLTQHEQGKESQGQIEQRKIDQIDANAQQSQLKELDPESFHQFIEEADADNDSNVFIDGVQSSLYLQGMTLDQIENDPALKMIAEQAQEAARLGGDVVLPVADFATTLTGTAHFEALRPHMTLSAETISPFRQEQHQTENQNYVQKIMEEAQQSTAEIIEAQSIYDSVRIQLVDTGMVNAQNANTMAQLVPAWATVYAKDNGLTVEEVYQNSGLTIEGPQTGEKARVAGDVLEQSPVDFQSSIKADFPDVKLSITGTGETVTLNKIIVPEDQRDTGTGSAVMQRVIEWADTNKKTIALTPSKDFGGNVKRLKGFYKKLGFVENKGKNKDFEISESMIREPSELLAQPTETGGARGYYDPSNSVIRLTEAADLSTFLHEFAHFMYEMEVKADGNTLQDINKWFKRNAFNVAAEANVYLDKAGADLTTLAQQPVDKTAQIEKSIKESEREINKLEKSETVGRLISNKGGLNRESMEAEGVDPANFKQRGKVFGKPLFPAKGGLTADGVAEALSDIKFNGKTYTANEALPIIEGMLAGKDPFTNIDVTAEIQALQEDIANLEGQLKENQAEIQRAFDLRAELEALQSIADSAPSDRPGLQDITDREAAERVDIEQGFSGLVTTADVKAFLDNGTSGSKTKDSAIRTAVHEQFARGFETYLMEGKAPSPELRNAFATFARWLTSIYRNLRDSLKVNLDAEMRQVYDRLLTTEEQIAAAAGRARHEPMFTDAAMAGMTEEEFSAYEKSVGKTKDKQTETLREKLIKELTRTTTKQWNEEKSRLIDNEIERLKDDQVYATAEHLRTGEIKLDRATVKGMIGEQITDLGVTSTVIPPALRKMTVTKGGMHPDQASVFFGYASGSEMLSDLITAPKIRVQAEVNAEKAMIEKHGNILTDGTIEQQADEAVQSEERGKLLLTELKALSRGTNQPAMERQTVKALAKEEIGKLSFRENQPAKYRKAEIRAAQEAATALANDDQVEAAAAKARQVMNYYLAIEATKAKNETAKIVGRMTRYRKKKVREEIIKAENGYWEQISKILSRFEFRKAASLLEVDAVNENINAWSAERIKEHGDGLIISPAVMNEMFITHWKNVAFDDLQGISDTVKNIEWVARYGNEIRLEDEKREFEQIVDEWADHINKQPTVFTPQRTTTTENKSWLRAGMAQMTKIPFLASWLDGGERVGLSSDLLMSEINNAGKREQDIWKEFVEVVMKAIESRSKDNQNRHLQKIFIPEIKTDLHDGNLTGGQVLAVALNTGNEGNLRKMLLGEGWANPENEAGISIDNPQLQSVLQHMTKKDWELVQLVWDQMEAIYPLVEEVHKRTTGLVPPRVEAVPVKTPFGTFKGGYYPVKYDHNRSSGAARNKDRADAQVDSMFGESLSIQASVNTGTVNARTGVYGPINLNLDVIPNHFQETIHYVTHHDAVRQVNKLINNDKIRAAIIAKLGPDEYAQLKPWLNDIAKDGKSAPPKTFIDAAFDRLRMGVTLGVMGFKASTGIIQVSGIFNTYAEVGSKHVHKSMRTVYGRGLSSIRDSTKFAFEHSNVMENRTKTMDREIKNALKKLEGKRGVLPIVQEASMKHIAFIQFYGADLLSWHAGYTSKLEETGDLERSYKYADWVVENVQGSGATKDMATLFRSQSKTHTTFTMFMTFFSSLWNMERDAVRGAKSGRYSASNLAAKSMFMFTLPVLFEMLMRDEVDFEDEDLAEKTLTKLALFPIASVPFVRDVASGIGSDYGYNSTPVASAIEKGLQGIKGIAGTALSDKEITAGQAKGATKLVGATFGIPGVSQVWATGEHLFDVIEEGEELTLHQLLFGPKRD